MSKLTLKNCQLLERLNGQPHLKSRIEQLLSSDAIIKADETENGES